MIAKAPEAVLAKEREKLADYQVQLTKLKEQQETIKALYGASDPIFA